MPGCSCTTDIMNTVFEVFGAHLGLIAGRLRAQGGPILGRTCKICGPGGLAVTRVAFALLLGAMHQRRTLTGIRLRPWLWGRRFIRRGFGGVPKVFGSVAIFDGALIRVEFARTRGICAVLGALSLNRSSIRIATACVFGRWEGG